MTTRKILRNRNVLYSLVFVGLYYFMLTNCTREIAMLLSSAAFLYGFFLAIEFHKKHNDIWIVATLAFYTLANSFEVSQMVAGNGINYTKVSFQMWQVGNFCLVLSLAKNDIRKMIDKLKKKIV